jgi:ATP-binding cassette subfamily C protein CydD
VAVLIGFRLLWGEMSYQRGFFILLLAPEFYSPLRAMGAAYHARMEALGAAERLVAVETAPELARPELMEGGETAPALALPPALSFEEVRVTYPGGRVGLNGLSLSVEAGECVAVVGPSGAGKSSLFNLILGFVAPSEGVMRIDGREAGSISLSGLRRSIAYVPQRPTLFSGTVAQNVALGDPTPDLVRVRRAASQARIGEMISALPEGIMTRIGSGGRALSGGEAQRIGLARAFYRNAPLVLLDEPSAHLDPEAEAAIHAAIATLKPGRTMLIIAHRAGTQKLADRAIRLEAGRLAPLRTDAWT